MTTTSIQTLAAEVRKFFVSKERGENDRIITLSDDRPEWVQELAMEAHGNMMPDDHRYAFIVEALDALVEADDPDEAEVEADIYTHELTAWLASRADRYGYCDQFMEDTGSKFMGTVQLLSWGQYTEKAEVLALVRSSLESQIEETADDDSE
jgi:hypothetical protein